MKEEELVKHQLEQHQRNQEIDKATQNMSIQERAGFVVGVEWADKHTREGLWDSEKVTNWLRENFEHYAYNYGIDDVIAGLTKAMEKIQ